METVHRKTYGTMILEERFIYIKPSKMEETLEEHHNRDLKIEYLKVCPGRTKENGYQKHNGMGC